MHRADFGLPRGRVRKTDRLPHPPRLVPFALRSVCLEDLLSVLSFLRRADLLE